MLNIGSYNKLKVVRTVDFGCYLSDEEANEVLLPTRYMPEGLKIEDEIDVFVYRDNEGRPIATTEKPYAVVDEFAWLKVKMISTVGAFLDWGIMKDLLVPYSEQKVALREEQYCLVYVYIDPRTQRVVASCKVDKFLDNLPANYERNQEVNILVAQETELGVKVIIENAHWGLIYKNEIFKPIKRGNRLKAYIKEVREDDKIDVSLSPLGYEKKVSSLADTIIGVLKQNGGYLAVHDKSSSDEIGHYFGCSKKSFKQTIGTLYKQQIVDIQKDGIRLISEK